MSAELLRTAAEILRVRSDRATDGPWHSVGQMGKTRHIYAEPGVLRGQGRDLAVAEGVFGRDATYIATMHPGVGLALADWLAAFADVIELIGTSVTQPTPSMTASYALARKIVGEQT